MKARRWWLLAIGGIALALLAGRALSGAYTDYRWYEAMDALALWRARFFTVTALRLASGAVATAFIFANLWAVRRTVVSLRLPRRLGNIEIAEEVPSRYLLAVAAAIALLFGALVTLPAETWTTFFLSNIGLPFNEPDPHFQSDLGFFVYWLPVERELYYWSVIAALLVTVLVIFLYALTPSLRWERGRLHISNYVRRHLVVLCAVLMVTLAWNHRLDAFEVLLAGSGENGALTTADLDGRIPINLALSVVTLVAAVLVVIFGWTGQVTKCVHWHRDDPAPQSGARPRPPAVDRARRSRRGGTRAGVRGDAHALHEARVRPRARARRRTGDADPVAQGGGALHGDLGRAGAGAVDVAVPRKRGRHARDRDDGRANRRPRDDHQCSGRDSSDSLASGRWTLARVLASTTDRRGDPLRLRAARNPGRDSEAIPAPVVYDGATGYAVLGDTAGTLAAPALSTTLSRLTHAWSLQNFRLLVSDPPRPTPRIVRRRGVRERVRAIAPFFVQGRRITPVASDGQLLWALDLYAASANYPVSQHVTLGDEEFSYVRHAATALVDAYSGTRETRRRFGARSDRTELGAALPIAVFRLVARSRRALRRPFRRRSMPGSCTRSSSPDTARRGEAPPRGQLPGR